MTFLTILLTVYFTCKLLFLYNKHRILTNFIKDRTLMMNNKEVGGIRIYKENVNINVEITDIDGNIIVTTESNV